MNKFKVGDLVTGNATHNAHYKIFAIVNEILSVATVAATIIHDDTGVFELGSTTIDAVDFVHLVEFETISKVCDCGALKCRTTHARWCSLVKS